MIRLLLIFLFFVCHSSYSYDSPENPKTYDPEKYYYLSSKIPKEVRQLNFYTDYCNIYLSSSLTKDSDINGTKENIHKYCEDLDKWNIKLKKKYSDNNNILLILSMTDDVILIYNDYKNQPNHLN